MFEVTLRLMVEGKHSFGAIKCFVKPQLKNITNCEKILRGSRLAPNLALFQGVRPDHVRDKSLRCCFRWGLLNFDQ